MFNILNDIGYAVITYDDGSKRVVRTTLNPDILGDNGITNLGENLFDLDRKRTIPIEGDVELVPTFNEVEVDEFNGFLQKFL